MILYHVTTCNILNKILKEGLKAKEVIDFGTKEKANIWFTNKEGIDAVAMHWLRSTNICVIRVDIPISYVKVGGLAYYGPGVPYVMEYYIRTKFKIKWIKDTWKYEFKYGYGYWRGK